MRRHGSGYAQHAQQGAGGARVRQQSGDAEICLPCHTLMHDGLLPPVGASLQRVAGSLSCGADKSSDVIHGRRIGTSSLRKGPFLHAPPVQEPR